MKSIQNFYISLTVFLNLLLLNYYSYFLNFFRSLLVKIMSEQLSQLEIIYNFIEIQFFMQAFLYHVGIPENSDCSLENYLSPEITCFFCKKHNITPQISSMERKL